MDSKLLEKIGLTQNESIVYLTLLKLGNCKTGEILKKARLNSGRIYETLEGLKIKGLVSESIINNIKYYSAAPPAQILTYLDKKRKKLEEEEKEIKLNLPELEKLKNSSPTTNKAVTYTGFRGLKTAVDEAFEGLTPKQEVLTIGVTQIKDKKYNLFWKKWSEYRIKKKVPARLLFSEKKSYYEDYNNLKFTKIKVLTGFTPVAVDIFGDDKTLILNYGKPFSCILIHDKNTATSFKQFFEQMWKLAKK